MPILAFRASVLADLAIETQAAVELLAYNENRFRAAHVGQLTFPLPDEPFVAAWEGYAANPAGPWAALTSALAQLQFPVRAGISQTDAYRAATRRGELPPFPLEGGVALRAPERLEIVLHPTLAGRIPVIIAPQREDFVALVQALTRCGEPAPIPDSMGACMVSGCTNWGRIRALRAAYIGPNWDAHFKTHIVPRKALYQDRFMILSDGWYSAVPPESLGMNDTAWRAASMILRREHECTHYFTWRVFGAMRNNLLDEVIADYMGILAAAGCFRAEWLLRFLGLEAYPHYRQGGRLENYRGALSKTAFGALMTLVARAARFLESFEARRVQIQSGSLLMGLCRLTLEELASDQAAARLLNAIQIFESAP